MKVTVKTVSDRITILENQKTISLTEEFTLNVFRWALEQQQRAEEAEAKAKNLNDGWLNAIPERDEARMEQGKLEAARSVRDNWKERAWAAEEKLAGLPNLTPVSNCLAFFASAIKSGENWSPTCQRDYDAALTALRNIKEQVANGQNLPASSVGGVAEGQVQPADEAQAQPSAGKPQTPLPLVAGSLLE